MSFSNLAFSTSFGVGFDRIDPPEDTGAPTGSGNGGWAMPSYEKPEKEEPKLEATQEPEVIEPVTAILNRTSPKPKLKLVVPDVDKSIEADQAKLLEAEIAALELAIKQDGELKAQAILDEQEAARLLRERHEAEEFIVLLLLGEA